MDLQRGDFRAVAVDGRGYRRSIAYELLYHIFQWISSVFFVGADIICPQIYGIFTVTFRRGALRASASYIAIRRYVM